jgi:hypothetical protein
MAVILAQRIMITANNDKITRAVFQEQRREGFEGEYAWVDVKELVVSEDGKSITFPGPGEKME